MHLLLKQALLLELSCKMQENKKLLIIFLSGLVIFLLLLMPASIIVNSIELPDRINVEVNRGNIWKGAASVYARASSSAENSESRVLLVDWRMCLSGSFPFISYCLNIQEGGNTHNVKVVGMPGSEIVLEDLKSTLPITEIIKQMQSGNLALLRLRGSLNIDLDRLVFDTVNQVPVEWSGRITLESGGFFNVDFPQLVFRMSQQSFISRSESSQSFGSNELPTIILQGADDTMTLDGNLQVLPDMQVKLNLEILARTELVEKTFAPLATNREGRKLFISYQGSLL